ncbi:hypothetical protein DHEL01_v201922 [Diaporthe helianthi]|uniref:Uncharacterized protein n=1 Tax=Diaporthe helianthi TaxID=158607 RepID=A0A2P5IB07_DIAHE|nr:hypothetical protein DHEL01_v201922 [Diaporthe helianthi]
MPDDYADMSASEAARETSTEQNMAAFSLNPEDLASICQNGSMSMAENARLAFEDKPKQPILSQISQESRQFMLGQGSFIFKKGDNGGFWWSSDDDVFFLDSYCRLPPLSSSLEALDGLELVRNIAVDSFQALEPQR